jgi:DNA-binding transcriptional MerR regulator
MSEADDKKKREYTISELAGEFDVTSRALRLYEESGLLSPRREGTKRIYSERDRVRLRLILRGKRLGCSLSEIKEIFDIYDTESGEKAQLVFFLERLNERKQILELQKQDVDLALEDLQQVMDNAQQALDKILLKEENQREAS